MYKRKGIHAFIIGLIVAIGLVMPPATPAAADGYPLNQSDSRIQAALNFLRNSEAGFPNLWYAGEKACYAIVAIEACGGDAHTFTNSAGDSLVDVIREGASGSLQANPSAALAHEYYLFAIVAAGENPHSFGGVNVFQQLEDMFDGTQIGNPIRINDDFWGIITLVGAGESPGSQIIQASKNHILYNQSPDGGWGSVVGGTGSDPCDTANAIMALRAAGENPWSPSIQDGLAYIKSTQQNDGGFPHMDGYASDTGSDARVIAALRACGIDPKSSGWSVNGHNAVSHALSLQQPDGGFAWHSGGSTDSWMTTYIMPALVGKHWPPDLFAGNIPSSPPDPSPNPTSGPLPDPPPHYTQDSIAPSISGFNPSIQSTVSTATPTISATYSDIGSGIDTGSVVIKVDTIDVSALATITGSHVTYTPVSALGNGTHMIELIVCDRAGNRSRQAWNFNVDDPSAVDTTPNSTPQITNQSKLTIIILDPASQETVNTAYATISAAYSAGGSGDDINSVILKVDTIDVSAQAVITDVQVTYISEIALGNGTHMVELIVYDSDGNHARKAWNFNVDATSQSPFAIDISGEIGIDGTLKQAVDLTSENHAVRLKLQKGTIAFKSDGKAMTQVIIQRAPDEPKAPATLCPIGPVYILEPHGASFNPPASVSLTYQERTSGDHVTWDTNGDGLLNALDMILLGTPDWENVAAADFRIAYFDDGGEWIAIDESVVNTDANTVTAQTSHFSAFTILASPPSAGTAGNESKPVAVGVITSEDGMLELGTFSDEVAVVVSDDPPQSPEDVCRIGLAYDLQSSDAAFDPALNLTLYYDEAALSEVIRWDTNGDGRLDLLDDAVATSPESFQLARFDTESNQWTRLTSVVNRDRKTVTADISSSGCFAILGGAAPPPVIDRVEAFPAEVPLGEDITLKVFVENLGPAAITCKVPLKIDGVLEYEKEVTLPPGKHEVTFSHHEPYTGAHQIDVNGTTGEFTVGMAQGDAVGWPLITGSAVAAFVLAGCTTFAFLRRRSGKKVRPV
jgi:hypothetical protein